MSSFDLNRRQFVVGASALTAANIAPDARGSESAKGPIAISSGNGLKATAKAIELVKKGWDPLDAAVEGVVLVEEDPSDMTVGYGGVPNEYGVVELDSSVMHGPTHRAGSVASLRHIKTPCRIAKLVMERTDHELLVGEGALKFAESFGYKREDLLTERSRKVWLKWRANKSDKDDWLSSTEKDPDPLVQQYSGVRDTGTIHCGVRNENGDFGGVTSTSGLFFKIPGRVGDSPIIGAGLYVDNEVGSCGSTGRGEANLLNCCSFLVVENMRRGMSPKEACLAALERVVSKTEKRLLKEPGKPSFDLRFYAISKDGRYAGVGMWKGMTFAIHDSDGNRVVDGDHLLE